MPRKSSRKAKSSTSSNKENEETNKVWVRDLLKDFDGEGACSSLSIYYFIV